MTRLQLRRVAFVVVHSINYMAYFSTHSGWPHLHLHVDRPLRMSASNARRAPIPRDRARAVTHHRKPVEASLDDVQLDVEVDSGDADLRDRCLAYNLQAELER